MREGGLIKGRNEAWAAREGKMGGRQRAEEGLSEKGREQVGMGSKGWTKNSREVSREGHRPVYSHKPFHNAARGLETLVLQMKNSEQVYIINSAL